MIDCRRWRPNWSRRRSDVIVARRHRCGARGQGGDHDDSDRLRRGRRPGRSSVSSPASAGRAATLTGVTLFGYELGGKAAGTAA